MIIALDLVVGIMAAASILNPPASQSTATGTAPTDKTALANATQE